MNKTIWSCWFDGRDEAPPLVQACLRSWELRNPGWAFRCLDATTVERYVPLKQYIDLDRQSLTAASLSDVVRILLLREFGGVWVDATLFCNRPLDDWLPEVMVEGFFAFAEPAPDRPLSTWFLSATSDHSLVSIWCRRTIEYWSNRRHSDDYFWFHHLFRDMCRPGQPAAEEWSRVPRVSADGPHALQFGGRMYRQADEAFESIDWTTPVFKLTHRLTTGSVSRGSLLEHLLKRDTECAHEAATPLTVPPSEEAVRTFASLSVSTENLGDHIQIIAGLRLLSRLSIAPTLFVDRDHEILSAPELAGEDGPVGILLNGWFKTNRAEWPPNPKLAPVIHGFHMRLFQCPELMSEASIDFFRRHQPIGCRDPHTEALLRSKGVAAFTSNCLSLTFPRRLECPETQTETFVVSRDDRITHYLPSRIGAYAFVSHYSGSDDFSANMDRAAALLETYASRAKLIVTTLLHCALPAIAMGIPVVVFYPLNDALGHASDRERFSALDELVPVQDLAGMDRVNWNPEPIDVSDLKLRILDDFYAMAQRWQPAPQPPFGPIAPASSLLPSG